MLQRVDAVSGALMLMPLGLFLQLGGFRRGIPPARRGPRPVPPDPRSGIRGTDRERPHGGARRRGVASFAPAMGGVAEAPEPVALLPQVRTPRHTLSAAGAAAVGRAMGPLLRGGGARRGARAQLVQITISVDSSRSACAAARAASAKSSPLPKRRGSRATELTSRPPPSAVLPLRTTAAHVAALCADARHQQGHVADQRAHFASSCGQVAPVTSRQLPLPFQSRAMVSATR